MDTALIFLPLTKVLTGTTAHCAFIFNLIKWQMVRELKFVLDWPTPTSRISVGCLQTKIGMESAVLQQGALPHLGS